jgi:hypothetical protein
MRQQRFAISVLVVLMAVFAGGASGEGFGTQISVSPMPFRGGQTIAIKANCSGPYTNLTAYVAVSDGTQDIFTPTLKNLGPVAKGQSLPVMVGFPVPLAVGKKTLSILVICLEGDESVVGEPVPDYSLKLIPRCATGSDPKAALPCKYATAKYWIMISRVTPS